MPSKRKFIRNSTLLDWIEMQENKNNTSDTSNKGDARDEGAGEFFGLFADVFAEGSVIEQKESAERELQRSGDETTKNDDAE